MPYGLAEWGDFRGWQIDSTNADSIQILDDRVVFCRFELAPRRKTSEEINEEADKGIFIWFKLRRKNRRLTLAIGTKPAITVSLLSLHLQK